MPQRKVSREDVHRTLLAPSYEFSGNQPGTIESYGYTADGRLFYVVTAEERSLVVTVVDL